MNKQGEFFNKKREGVLGYLIKSILFISLFFLAGIGSQSVFAQQNNCSILPSDINFTGFNSNFLDDQSAVLHLTTSNCIDTDLELIIWEDDYGISGGDTKISLEIPGDDDVEVLKFTPIANTSSFSFITGGNECDDSGDPDCLIYLEIRQNDTSLVDTESFLSIYDTDDLWLTDKSFINKGVLLGNASEFNHWKLLDTQGIEPLEQADYAQQTQTQQPTYDTSSPCYKAATQSYDENCYELLAPIPGIGETENGRTYIGDLKNYKLGNYVQQLFNVAIGILMVLSVIMIVVAGVEYMTVESIYGKSDAKKRIVGATTGLILALGIFLILKTINPKLLEINFGDGIDVVMVEVPEFGDGPPPAGTRYKIGSKTYEPFEQIGVWPPAGTANTILFSLREKVQSENITNITFSQPTECTTWGQGSGCISTWYEQGALNTIFTKLKSYAAECNCEIVVTEGTKLWAHASHRTYLPRIDLRSNSSNVQLWNKYFEGQENPYIGKTNHDSCKNVHKSEFNSDVEFSILEGGVCGQGSTYSAGEHWHINFK